MQYYGFGALTSVTVLYAVTSVSRYLNESNLSLADVSVHFSVCRCVYNGILCMKKSQARAILVVRHRCRIVQGKHVPTAQTSLNRVRNTCPAESL
jgi:hypothetical protein